MSRVRIRAAEAEQDAPRILAVYAPYILRTAVTFEEEVPTAGAFTQRVRAIAAEFPYILLEIDGELAGYAYAHRQAERAAYRYNAELSIYLAPQWTGRGLGGPLYALLLRLLGMQGYLNFYALITASNAGSVAFHERMGFARVGLHPRTGYKFGAWHDVLWLCRAQQADAPGEIRPVRALDAAQVARETARAEAEIEEKLRMSSKTP